MKISLNWLKQFTDIDVTIDELVAKIGAQLGAVEEVIDLGKKYQHIVIAEVISCEKHPNADKLSVCRLDDGGKTEGVERDAQGYVQVVCGAPNVRSGLKVAWIPPGATVPSTAGTEPFVLGSRELRGVISNGMIASAAELAVSEDHSGILELEQDVVPGVAFAEAYELNDYIIDIENKMFTHRPDCFGILGVAREVSGILGQQFVSPDWYTNGMLDTNGGQVHVKVETDLVPRFMAAAVKDVTVAPSPAWLQSALGRVGFKSINNIVDITNYLSYVTAQPLHAYDADKLPTANSLEARMSRKGDKVLLLNGKELELQDESTVLITSGDVPVGVGGVMGGKDTEVDGGTKNIIIECASFNMYNIRRTSMKYGLFTDAVTRFNKGQSPLQNMAVLAKAVQMAQELAGGEQSGSATDVHRDLTLAPSVSVSAEFINVRLGLELKIEQITQLLRNVEFVVEDRGEDSLEVTPPFWRTDIEIPEDIVEEVGRLYGFDHLPSALPMRAIVPAQKDQVLSLKSKLRDTLRRAGANEVLTYSFVHGNLLEKAGQDKNLAFELSNALSPELQYYRQSLTPSLLEKVRPNIKAGFDEFAIFEVGKSHIKGEQDRQEPEVPMEFNALSLVYASRNDSDTKSRGAAYYQVRQYLDTLLGTFGVHETTQFSPLEGTELRPGSVIALTAAPYEPSRSALVVDAKGRHLGVVGEFKQSVIQALKLPSRAAGFEVGLGLFMGTTTSAYKPLSKFPKISQDISLRVSTDQPYQPLHDALQQGLRELAGENITASLSPLDIYQKDSTKHITFRLTAAHHQKTLVAAEVNGLLDQLAERAKQTFNAERI